MMNSSVTDYAPFCSDSEAAFTAKDKRRYAYYILPRNIINILEDIVTLLSTSLWLDQHCSLFSILFISVLIMQIIFIQFSFFPVEINKLFILETIKRSKT